MMLKKAIVFRKSLPLLGSINRTLMARSFLKNLLGTVLLVATLMGCTIMNDRKLTENIDTTRKILIIVTNHGDYPTREDKTGLWLTELTHFYDVVKSAGFDVEIASPEGGETPLDDRSLGWLYLDKAAKAHLRAPDFKAKLENTFSVNTLSEENYAAIYFAGGHGTMWDFKDNTYLKKIAEGIYSQGGYVTSVCHGAAALLNLETSNGRPLVENKKVTGFSNREEWLAGLDGEVPFSLEDELRALGAKFTKAWVPFVSYAISDGRVITGQNPSSGKAVAEELLNQMRLNN
ncbi:type 1 glutamine amidotransferase domain-containing protein [Vibrio fluvialis]|nr:type 1 glutamine amidotransferase domain-containing protein [Vibrio fluvialis]MBY8267679.1 type 1 glutamine amidotransferase domain-containing protein [Vibrio fluvialis]